MSIDIAPSATNGPRPRETMISFARLLSLAAIAALATTAAWQPRIALAQGGELNQESAVQFSLYWENFKNKNYIDGLPNLVWLLQHDPGFPGTRDRNFEKAVEAYEALALEEEDAARKRALFDSALVQFDRVVPVIQGLGGEIDAFEWTRNKGRFIQEHLADLPDLEGEAIAAYSEAYRLEPARLDPYYLDVILNAHYSDGDIGATLGLLRELNDTRGEEDGVELLVRKYFAVIPPEEQIGFLEEQLAEDETNVEVIQQLFELYEQEGYHGRLLELAPKVLALDPTPEVLRMLTRMYLEEGDTDRAIEVFNQLRELPGVELEPQDLHNMGIAQQELENYSEARRYYQEASKLDPEYSPALRAVADLYATAAARCGVEDREQSAVFWLIADAYQRAGDGAGAARMKTAFPTAEDIFYVQKWTNGEPTSVSYTCRGMTISGTTTVRQR